MQEFYRGGGTKADTISQVPDKIDGMLRNYKKVAVGTFNITENIRDIQNKRLNIDFVAKYVFIQIRTNEDESSIYYLQPQTISVGEGFSKEQHILIYGNGESKEFKIIVTLKANIIDIYHPHAPSVESYITFLK